MFSTSRASMDEGMAQPLQEHSMSISSTPQQGTESPGENPATDLEKSESDRIKNFGATVLSAIMVFITFALSHYKDMKPLYSTTSHNEVHLSNLLVAEGLLVFMTFTSAVVLVMVEICMSQHGRRCRAWYWVLTVLVAVTGVMLILADTVLVIVTNRNNSVLAVILAPVMVLVTVLMSAGAWMEGQQPSSTPDSSSSRYDSAMKGASDMAFVGTVASFTLQGTVIFGYLKTPAGGNQDSKQGRPPLDLAACYATSTLSLIVMMAGAMPLRLLPGGMLEILVMIVEKLRKAMLVALLMMALVVSVEFLDGFVVLSFFPEAIALVLYYAVKFLSQRKPSEENSPHDSTFRMVTTGGFVLMTGLYAAFVGIDHYNVYVKVAVFVLLLAVLSSLSRLAIPLHMPDMGVGGAVEICIASVALAFPLLAFLVACPLVLKVFLDLYLHR